MWVLNILFAVYALFLNERILLWSEDLINKQKENWQLGLLCILAFLVELPAMWIAMKDLRQREPQIKLSDTLVFVVWVFHTVIGVMLAINILTSFGINIDSHKTIGTLVILIAMVREFGFLAVVFYKNDSPIKVNPKIKFLANVGLLYFTCIVYTSTWGLIATGSEPINQGNIILTLLNLVCALILFVIFYIPTRLPYFIEETSLFKNKKQQNLFVISNIIVCLAALSPLFVFENGKMFISQQRAREIVAEKILHREFLKNNLKQRDVKPTLPEHD